MKCRMSPLWKDIYLVNDVQNVPLVEGYAQLAAGNILVVLSFVVDLGLNQSNNQSTTQINQLV